MSLSSTSYYEIERRRRDAIANERISRTTENFYRNYCAQYEKMLSLGYKTYIPNEMESLNSDLKLIRSLLSTNPREARELSFEVGSYIKSLDALARVAIEQFDRAERLHFEELKTKKVENQNKLLDKYYEKLSEITNPIVANFSQDELAKIKNEIEKGNSQTVDTLEKRLNVIFEVATKKAEEWKTTTKQQQKKEVVAEKIAETEQQLLKESIENKDKAQEFIKELNILKENLSDGSVSISTIENEIKNIENKVDEELISEEVRREAVKAIVKQLKSQEFIIAKPQIVDDIDGSYVKIVAEKPSGKRVACKVDLKGTLTYKFDNYEGMTCLKDIEKFNVDLEQIYSVKLSDERVLWSNPDKLSKDAEKMPKSNGGMLNGK